MADFALKSGFEIKHVTPVWPRANGMVERFNRSMKEAVQAAHMEGRTIKEAAEEFLEVYRATPHSATQISPYEAMHGGRQMKTTLPMFSTDGQTVDRERERKYKERMAETRKGKEHRLRVGDKVLIRQPKKNKLTPLYNPIEMTVVEVKGSSIVATDGQTSVFRDASYFKQVSEDEDDQPIDNSINEQLPVQQQDTDDITPQNQDHSPASTLNQEVNQQEEEPQTGGRSERTVRERRRPGYLDEYEC